MLFFDIVLDAFIDTLKLIPFLFVAYLAMEWLEHKTGSRAQAAVQKAGRMGPLFGGILGIVPQCGFSAAAANLYAGGIITAGSLAAVFLSTSDEMLPILISESVPVKTIVLILAVKMFFGVLSGFFLDFLYHDLFRRKIKYKNIHIMCESEHCKCEEGIWFSSFRHTLRIALFLFVISLALNGIMEAAGTEALKNLAFRIPVLGELVTGLIGLVPNCAASVVITQLYTEGIIGIGQMMTGLLAGAGVGFLVLFRVNHRHPKQNAMLLLFVYLASVFWGVVVDVIV